MTTTLHANGIDLAYDSLGPASGEPVLLIAGLGTQMLRWGDPFRHRLAELGYRVIRFDNRDSGQSTSFASRADVDLEALLVAARSGLRPALPYTLADMAEDAVGLLDALSIPRAHVVGRSMGGMIAQVMASDHPSRVRSLTSIMSATGNPDMPPADAGVLAMLRSPPPDPGSDRHGFLDAGVAFARRIAGSAHSFDDAACRALLELELQRGITPGGPGRQLAAMILAGDRRPRLATIQAPSLVVHGSEDPLIPPACGRDTAASIPGAELMMIDGMGHDLPPGLFHTVALGIDRTARRARTLPAA